jgi:murein L,D-transpeptidase YafK
MPMPFRFSSLRRLAATAAAVTLAALLSGCVGEEDSGSDGLVDRAYAPLSPQMLALMQAKGTSPDSPVLFRTYKKEAEFQVWKMRSDGRYALLRIYPMCRWSGQLGPKKRQGDRQVPEGFYAIYPSQMNPHSNYYLSFNVGYPNLYDRVHGYSGDSIMVHGICSSAGCFSMTNSEIGEIYTIARLAFAAGQPEIQMQSMPFHMTAENLAKYRLDPNIDFWRELKNGADNFEVTKHEVAVGVCNMHYVFNARAADGQSFDPTAPCPALRRDEIVHDEVVAKQARDDARVAELVGSGVVAVHTAYADGGQNPVFKGAIIDDVSRPDALATGPVDVAIKHPGRAPTLMQLKAQRAKDLAAAIAAEKKAQALRSARGETDPIDTQPTGSTGAIIPGALPPPPKPAPFSNFFGFNKPAAQPAAATSAPAVATAEPAQSQVDTPNPQQPAQTASAPSAPAASHGFSFTNMFASKPAPQPAPATTQAASAAPSATQSAAPASAQNPAVATPANGQ